MLTVSHMLTLDLNRLRDDSTFPDGDANIERAGEIEELIAKALHLYARLNRQHERWAGRVRDGLIPFKLEEAKPWQAAFQQWADDARRIIRAARALEGRGFYIEQLDLIRNALRQNQYDGVDIEGLLANASMHGPAKGIPGSQVRDEIQRRLNAQGQ